MPFCTAVPACSITVATMSVEPVDDTDVAVANSVIVDSVGAVNGTLSHAVAASASSDKREERAQQGRPEPPCYHREKHNEAMQLAQGTRSSGARLCDGRPAGGASRC